MFFVYGTLSQSEAFSMADRVVIMSHVKIEQFGEPQGIYRAPRTKFVAEFLGSSNIFSGRVAALADGLVDIATPAGDFEVVRNPAKDLARDDATTFEIGRAHV